MAIWKLCALSAMRDRIDVILPYRDLERLLESGDMVNRLIDDNIKLHKQLDALRLLFSELLDKVNELDKLI